MPTRRQFLSTSAALGLLSLTRTARPPPRIPQNIPSPNLKSASQSATSPT